MRRTAAAFAVALCAAAWPGAASARAAATLEGGSVVFFSDTLALFARDGAALALADGTRAHADAAYLDLKTDRAVLAGHARIARGAANASADAIVIELDTSRVDLLDARNATVTQTTRALDAAKPAEFDAQRFTFPDVEDRGAFIRAKHAAIVPHADVRLSPATFPNSVGSVPVPSYLYTYATGAGFASSALSGATFDQPYGLWGSPNSLTALHARWESGPGAALALQQQFVSGDDAFAALSFDAPLHGYTVRGFNGYRRLGARYTAVADATGTIFGTVMHGGLTAAFGAAGARLDYTRTSGGFSKLDFALRTPDRPLFGGATWRLTGDLGYDAQRGGLLTQLPDARSYATVWRHGLDFSVATPVVRAPLGTTLSSTFDVQRTWYAFPHHFDQFGATAFATKTFSRKVSLFAGYQGTWNADVYPNAQAIFYPSPSTPILTPDGTPYYGYAAFTGAKTFRLQNLTLQVTPDANTAYRLTLTHTADFPQFNGYGRPQWEIGGDVRFRPFPNIGLDVGRAYDFAWGGTRWVPRWSFAITP
ncbi:MAG: hypothetical protein JO036_11065 [Candidatus Eremiobacteraeota bacterium]|nr:hypothetical protein [Candidatus Eremiobacteraeota bacterium]